MSGIDVRDYIARDLGEHGNLTFSETPRRAYYLERDGKRTRCASVTTVLGVVAKGAGMDRWQQDQGARACLAAVRAGELDPSVHHDEEAGPVMRAAGFDPMQRRDDAAQAGLTMHDALAVWSEGGDLPNPADLTPDARPFLVPLSRLLIELEIVPTAVEQLTCSPSLMVAGRFDLRGVPGRGEYKGMDVLLDAKFREKPATRESDCWQLNGYATCEHELGEPWPDRLLACAIGPVTDAHERGQVITHEVDVPRDAFERIVGVYRLNAETGKPLAALRRAAAKARKAEAAA